MRDRPAGPRWLGAEAEAPHPARKLRPGDGHGGGAVDFSGAQTARSMPQRVRIPRWLWVARYRRLPANGGAAGWLRRGLRSDDPVIAGPVRHTQTAGGGHLLRARRREGPAPEGG